MTATARIFIRDTSGEILKGVMIRVLRFPADFAEPVVLWEGITSTEHIEVNYDETLPQPQRGTIRIVGKEGYLERHTRALRPYPGQYTYNFALTPIPLTYDMSRWSLRDTADFVRPKPSGIVWSGFRDGYRLAVPDSLRPGEFEVDHVDGSFMGNNVLWIQGRDFRYAHISGTSWFTKFLPSEEVVPPSVFTIKDDWDRFFANPDVITAIGLTPSSVHESFSLVFSGYSIINKETQAPELGDYVSVALILGGITLAAVGTVMALIETIILVPLLKDLGIAATTAAAKITTSAAKVTTKTGAKQWLTTSEGVISTSVMGIPGKAVLIAKSIVAMPMKFKIFSLLSGTFLLTQLDATGWFFGLSPEASHSKAAKLLGSVRSDLIRLDGLVDDKSWTEAAKLVPSIRTQIDEVKILMGALPVKFWEKFGFSFEDKDALLETLTVNLDGYISQHPQLVGLPVTFPKEFMIDDVSIEDGDTLIWSGHPEAADRIRIIGIDAHESETEAGKEETEYLKTLIEGKQVKILTHQYGAPAMTIDVYGRLLGGVFLGDTDISLAMLEHFGKSILTPTKYQDKYRWIDWDEYKRVADSATGPAVKEFKIYIDSEPSNAKLYIDGRYTHHFTPSNETELKDVMDMLTPGEHIIKAEKAGKAAAVTVNVTDGANPDIMLTLKTVGLEPVTPEEPPEIPEIPEVPEAVPFKFNILSTPSRAKVYVDGVYTHHLTPSDEKELEDVMNLLSPGKHVIRATKAGKQVEKEVEITSGYNEPIYLTLQVVGLPKSREDLVAEIQGYRAIIEKLEAELAQL